MLTKEEQSIKLNMGTMEQPQCMKVNVQLMMTQTCSLRIFLHEFKDLFAWTYKDLKGIPLELTQHKIELSTIIPLVHQAKYYIDPNYVFVIK
jgi:hypothetical protein